MKTFSAFPLRRLLMALLVFFSLGAWAQPTNNPWRAFDPTLINPHWSDSLPWTRVVNIQTYRNLVRDTLADGKQQSNWLHAYRAAAQDLFTTGGGVLYFPPLPSRSNVNDAFFGYDSSYYFSDHLVLLSGVILRGQAASTADSADAHKRVFKPKTYFEFPRYNWPQNPSVSVPNSTAFKFLISNGKELVNAGVVDIDINRAGINIHPSYRLVQVPNPNGGAQATTSWPAARVRNILVFGTRTNNVAFPDPGVPSGSIDPGHRYLQRLLANVDILGDENLALVNSRMNDADSIDAADLRDITLDRRGQAGYRAGGVPGGGGLSAERAMFDPTYHYGVFLNRLKLIDLGVPPAGFLSYVNSADQEPQLFAKGIVADHNWIFHKERVGIQAGGLGVRVTRNVIRDEEFVLDGTTRVYKFTYLNSSGTAWLTNRIATFENRGVDVSGRGAIVEDNIIEVYRTNFPGIDPILFSADGEGFYAQGPNGTNPKDFVFRRNRVRTSLNGMAGALNSGQGKGFNGIYNTATVENVLIEDNDCGGQPIWINTNFGSQRGLFSNVRIRNNTEVRGIQAAGDLGGSASVIAGNSGATTNLPQTDPLLQNNILYSCHIRLNEVNGAPANQNSNTNLTPNACVPLVNQNACTSPYATVRISSPQANATFINGATGQVQVNIEVDANPNGCAVDAVELFQDLVSVGQATLGTGTTWEALYNLPSANGVYYLKACATTSYGGGQVVVCSEPVMINLALTSVASSIAQSEVKLFPNPARESVQVQLDGAYTGTLTLRLRDVTGRIHQESQVEKADYRFQTQAELSGLAPGLYFLELSDGAQRRLLRLVKE